MGENESSRREFLRKAALSGAAMGVVAGGLGGAEAADGAAAASAAGGADASPGQKVPRKPLGKTGQSVPILLMGCAQKFDEKYDKLLHRAYADGVDYLDTALAYADGMSHRTIAPFIKQVGDRKKLWITSKGEDKGSPDSHVKELDLCLSQLETDYLDLYFMHGIDDLALLEPAYLKMGEQLKKSGKTRFFGFSCHDGNVAKLLDKAALVGGKGGIDAIMFRYDFSKYGDLALNKAMDACKAAGIGLIAMKTQRSVPGEAEKVVQFKSKSFNLPQAKLKAVWADERIDAVVSHIDNTTKLKENVDAAKSPVKLTMDEFQQLQRIARATAHYHCQGCSHLCESALEEPVAIASQLRFLMYHECYGDSQTARALYHGLDREARRLDGIDFSAAAAVCPQGIDIAARLREAREALA